MQEWNGLLALRASLEVHAGGLEMLIQLEFAWGQVDARRTLVGSGIFL
jgi:hypothetical protein